MEDRRRIIRVAILTVALLFPSAVFAYEPNSTHDALTLESARFYNEHQGEFGTPQLTESMIQRLRSGAVHEDDDLRMAHHFYDPIYDRGLKQYVSSKVWAELPVFQGSWGNLNQAIGSQVLPPATAENDFSWQRAIYEYVYGDRGKAFEALGHTLHLIEDASVPDHTRNDAHIPLADGMMNSDLLDEYQQKSPFEEFTDRFSVSAGNVETSNELLSLGKVPYTFESLGAYFDNAAMYSNTNFYSKSTIESRIYDLPYVQSELSRVLSSGGTQDYGLYNGHTLARLDGTFSHLLGTTTVQQSIVDDVVLSAYWSLTSKEAVLNASGVIRLFFIEAEKERRSGEIYRMYTTPPLQQTGISGVKTVGTAGDIARQPVIGAMLGYHHATQIGGTYVTPAIFTLRDIGTYAKSGITNTMLAFNLNHTPSPFAPQRPSSLPQFADQKIDETQVALREIDETLREPARLGLVTSPAVALSSYGEAKPAVPQTSSGEAKPAVAGPPSPSTLPTPSRTSTLASIHAALLALLAEIEQLPASSIVAGTSTLALLEEDNLDPAFAQTSYGEAKPVSPALPSERIDQGTPQGSAPMNADDFFLLLASLDGASSPLPIPPPPPSEEPIASTTDETASSTPDTIAPAVPVIDTPVINATLSDREVLFRGTAEASSTLLIAWTESTHATILSLHVPDSGIWETSLTLPEGDTTLSFTSRDDAGNLSDEVLHPITVIVPPPAPVARPPIPGELLFNEILFPCRQDTAIELTNISPDPLILDGLTVTSSDGIFAATLSGTIAPKGFTVLAVSFTGTPGITGLGSTTQVFRDGPFPPPPSVPVTYTLRDPSGTPLDLTEQFSGFFCRSFPNRSIEKVHPTDPSLGNPWSLEFPFATYGTASDGTPLLTTLGRRNSTDHIMENSILGNMIITKDMSPLIIWVGASRVHAGGTLTIGPGVHISFHALEPTNITPSGFNPRLVIDGTLRIEGTAEDPVHFAGFDDPDARAAFDLPPLTHPVDYGKFEFTPGSSASISHTVFSHMGNDSLTFTNASATLSHVRFEDTQAGIVSASSTITLSDAIFRDIENITIRASLGSDLTIASATMSDMHNGGIFIGGESTLTIDDLTMERVHGAGIMADGGTDVSVTNSDISAPIFTYNSSLAIASTTISDVVDWPALTIVNGNATITDSTITGNDIGIEAHGTAVVSVASSTVSGNTEDVVNDGATIVVVP